MTSPLRQSYPEPPITVRDPAAGSNSVQSRSAQSQATVRREPPAVLLQFSREEQDNRPTAPAPFWVSRVDDVPSVPPLRLVQPVVAVPVAEPEPRQTTPSVIRLRARRRWLSMLCAVAIVAGGVGAANILAQPAVAIDR